MQFDFDARSVAVIINEKNDFGFCSCYTANLSFVTTVNNVEGNATNADINLTGATRPSLFLFPLSFSLSLYFSAAIRYRATLKTSYFH